MYKTMNREREESSSIARSRPRDGIMIICGEADPVIVPNELKRDVAQTIGGLDELTFKIIDSGHDFPIVRSGAVVNLVLDFWGRGTSGSE